ncbi:TK protein kinase [Salpingoeca rosetta]|uniref:non-specific protein-tyrosine kinase n=1 Tax=Salpingoeca rosetta (strain ATCC 50818 / BSB-021) TaxID=946362 RepID=F2TW81_SALR5|nr:TK protein kinase [Salpingoeca rosetta]EGD72327.1 TK protein kinase [Salpingoeca rosetta]|eukprot:XP_004998897.1 TK protein kinase [Salpingoeca rosetta]
MLSEPQRIKLWLELKISRQDAEKALHNEPEGTFIIRASASRPTDYVLSVRVGDGIKHNQLRHNGGKMLTKSGKLLRSLPDLVQHYRTEKDGLAVLLGKTCTYFDPPEEPPVTYANLIRSHNKLESDYERAADGLPPSKADPEAGLYENASSVVAAMSSLPPMPSDTKNRRPPARPLSDALSTHTSVSMASRSAREVVDEDEDDAHDYENDYIIPELLPFEIEASRLQVMHELGAGQFGQVFAAWLAPCTHPQAADRTCEERDGQLVAVKSCKAASEDVVAVKQFMQEAETLARFSHENVLKLIGVITQQKPLRIIVEHIPYGDLRAVLKSCRRNSIRVNALEKTHITTQVAAGMAHLTAQGFVHRDLAARNVLLGRYCAVKIADFGLSRQLEDETQNYIVRSRCLLPIKWMAPESLIARVFTHATDVYSFGVFLWEVETQAKTPWKGSSTDEVVRRVRAGERLPCPSKCSDGVYDIMKLCWHEDPAQRASFTDLHQQLQALCTIEKQRSGRLPRDIGQLVPTASSKHAATLAQLDPRASVFDTSKQDDDSNLEFPREDLRFVCDLGTNGNTQLVVMETSSGFAAGARESVVVKMLTEGAPASAAKALRKEMGLLRKQRFNHPNVVSLLGFCSREEPHFIILEYLPFGDLLSYLRSSAATPARPSQLGTPHLMNMCENIAAGAAYLAHRGVVHRDLAARNCLVGSDLTVKISNFGLGHALHEQDYYTAKGDKLPLRWMAPEAVSYAKYSLKSDVWSFGVTAWEVFTFGKTPYGTLTDMELADRHAAGKLPQLELPARCPDAIKDVVMRCFMHKSADRPTFDELHDAIKKYLDRGLTMLKQREQESAALPSSADIDWTMGVGEIVLSGFMIKQGGGRSTLGRQSWKKRWFVLRDSGHLSYHKSLRPDAKPLRIIDLREVTAVEEKEPFNDSFSGSHCLSLITPDRTFNFVCADENEYKSWLEFLSAAIASLASAA